jgi:hypothetical protein
VVRGAAVWALGQLGSKEHVAEWRERRRGTEVDVSVIDEWDAAPA